MGVSKESISKFLTPWRLGGFGDLKKKQQFSVALPTP